MNVLETDLEVMAHLGSRGQSEAIQVVRTTHGCTHLFKRYNEEAREGLSVRNISRCIEWRTALDADDREYLDVRTAWVRHLAEDGDGNVVGVLIPLAGPAYWTLSSGVPTPRDGSRLLRVRAGGERFNTPHRLHLLGELLVSMLWLHERNVVIGDLQLSNLLVGNDTHMYLIDMDSVWINDQCAFPLTENMRYAAPFDGGHHTKATDLWKFSLISSKVLALDGSARSPSVASRFMTVQQFEIIEALHAGESVDSSDLSRLARMWSRAVTSSGEYIFSPDKVTRVHSGEPASFLIEARPVTTDYCSNELLRADVSDAERQPRNVVASSDRRDRLKLVGVACLALLILVIMGLVFM